MNTITKQIEIIQPTSDEAIAWLKSEYLRKDGTSILELIYIDYRDSYEDANTLQDVLKEGWDDNSDRWQWDAQDESIREIEKNFIASIDNPDDKEIELTDEVREDIRMWCQDHDQSTLTEDLLKNTHNVLCYVETPDHFIKDDYGGENLDNEALIEKYATTEEQKKEIQNTFNESFYSAPVAFYFYADPLELYKAIHNSADPYITIDGAYCSTVDRTCGSNWLGDKALFTVSIPREDFVKTFFVDKAKGTGYGWDSIAGQTDFEEASIMATKEPKGILLAPEVSEAQKREGERFDLTDEYKENGII